ncbi:acid-resistance membrane protein [compost metagenome]
MPKRIVNRITDRRGPAAAGRHRGLKAVLAVAIVALGVAAFLEPTRTAIPSVRLAGAIILAAGLFQVALALMAGRQDPLAKGLGIGIVNTSVGVMGVAAPQLGVKTLALVLAVAQIVIGAERILAALRDRGAHWPWLLALGALLVASGTAIASGWPATGLTAIGRFVGINLVVEGVSWLLILRHSPERLSVTMAPEAATAEPVSHGRS